MEAALKQQGLDSIPGAGPLPVSVPGAVMGWCDLHDKFGKLPFAEVFAPAIGYARDGHPVAQVIGCSISGPLKTHTETMAMHAERCMRADRQP
jgi:gamma-glutamyltranspeptidase/glutathione hydrolase